MVMSQRSNDNPLLETSRHEIYFYEFWTEFKNNSRNVHLVNYKFELQLTFFNFAPILSENGLFQCRTTFLFFVQISTGRSYDRRDFWGWSSLASRFISLNGTLVIFHDCILILDAPLSSYYERYDKFFRHFRPFRRFRSFVSFVRFESAPVGMAAAVVM